ncbi:MAG: TCR/Tet family MFS transporter [Xanthobacteraceae bacterium]|nr:TCR/Tet family MFS transporter [Xanthobacteraceae bacterium]
MTGTPIRRAAFTFIFITVLLDMLALGIVIPVVPKLVLDFVGGDAVKGADYLGLFGTAWALMQFLFSPIHGALSDRFGRRPIILLSNFGLGLDYILMALAPTLMWLFVGRIISGVTAASVSTAYAYVADVAEPDRRAKLFGMLGVAFGAGFVLGPAMGGIAGSFDPRLPFWIAAGLSLLNGLYGLFILPESLPPQKRAPFNWRRANPLGSLILLRSHPQLLGLAVAMFLVHLAHSSLPNIGVLYMMYRYSWAEHTVGFVMAVVGLCSMIVQGGLIGPAVKHFGESQAMYLGLAFGIAGFAAFGLATSGPWFLAGIPILALWGIASAAMLALMSRRVGESEQGQLQGANASMMGIASLIGPGIFTQSFALSIGANAVIHLPGAPFLLAAVMLAVSLAVAVYTMHKTTQEKPA